MNSQDEFYVGKCIQILYRLINNSKNLFKMCQTSRLNGSELDVISPLHPYYSRDHRSTNQIYPNYTKPPDCMRQIWTACLICTRITLETAALQVT